MKKNPYFSREREDKDIFIKLSKLEMFNLGQVIQLVCYIQISEDQLREGVGGQWSMNQ